MKQGSQTWLLPRAAQLLSRLRVSLFRLGHPESGLPTGAEGHKVWWETGINPDPELKSWLWFLLAS